MESDKVYTVVEVLCVENMNVLDNCDQNCHMLKCQRKVTQKLCRNCTLSESKKLV